MADSGSLAKGPAGVDGPGAGGAPNRRERAKARTRAALIQAAQRCIIDGRLHAPVLEITQAADVGLGSFYNHFESREQLFDAAIDAALEQLGAVLDQVSAELHDPAAVFAQSFRLIGRLYRTDPVLMHVAMSRGAGLMRSTTGLVPRARRDLDAGMRAGRFSIDDVDVALAIVVGSSICLCELLHQDPKRAADAASDEAAFRLLRMLGLTEDEADRIAAGPLPTWGQASLAARRAGSKKP